MTAKQKDRPAAIRVVLPFVFRQWLEQPRRANLDSESEALIQHAMERPTKGRTSIVIAHRLSTVRSLDRILVFDREQIVEQGTHASLTARVGGIYRGLFERQATEFISAAE